MTIEDRFRQWLGEQWPDGNTRWHQDDLEEAFCAGWMAALDEDSETGPYSPPAAPYGTTSVS